MRNFVRYLINMGQPLNNIGICKAMRRRMNTAGVTVTNLSNALGRSRKQTFIYLNNPYCLTLGQLTTVAGCLGVPVVELFALVHYSRSVASPELKQTLSEITAKVEREENNQ